MIIRAGRYCGMEEPPKMPNFVLEEHMAKQLEVIVSNPYMTCQRLTPFQKWRSLQCLNLGIVIFNTTKKYTSVMIRVCHSRSRFCHACTSMTILWQNQDSHTCAVVEVFHDITKIIITEVCTSMTINRASQKCFRQGWPTRGIHRNETPLSYQVGFWIR